MLHYKCIYLGLYSCDIFFQHPSMAIVKGAGLVMKAIIEEGNSETAAQMQELALAEVTFFSIRNNTGWCIIHFTIIK